jgi:hypothetical protein
MRLGSLGCLSLCQDFEGDLPCSSFSPLKKWDAGLVPVYAGRRHESSMARLQLKESACVEGQKDFENNE